MKNTYKNNTYKNTRPVAPTGATQEVIGHVVAKAVVLAKAPKSKAPSNTDHPSLAPGRENRLAPNARSSRSAGREASATASGLLGTETARRLAKGCADRETVVLAARRVASRQANGMTDQQVLRWVLETPGRSRMLGGYIHEMLDAADLEQLAKLTRGRTRTLSLYSAHNRPGLDGAYVAAARKAGKKGVKEMTLAPAKQLAKRAATKPAFAQHKLSENPEGIASAAKKVHPCLRGKTEAVVGRGSKKAGEKAVEGKMRIREAGRSVKDINRIVEAAADPKRVNEIGKKAASRLGVKAVGGAGLLSGGLSVALDVKGFIRGDKKPGEVAENAGWAAGEGMITTAAGAAVTTALAPSIAAGTAALAGSTAAGTTAMAAGLATLGPIGIGIGCGIAVGFGVKKLRKSTRG